MSKNINLYQHIVQKNHEDFERYKCKKEYSDSLKNLEGHFKEMELTMKKVAKADIKNNTNLKIEYNLLNQKFNKANNVLKKFQIILITINNQF